MELRLNVPAFLLGHPVEKPKSKNYHLVVIYLLKRLFQCFCARVSTVLSHSDNLKHKRAWHAKVIFFSWASWDGTLWFTFKRTKISHHFALRVRKRIIYLNSHRYFVVYCLNTSKQKQNASVPHSLLFPSQALFGLVTQRHIFPVWERARCVMRPNNGCKRDYA